LSIAIYYHPPLDPQIIPIPPLTYIGETRTPCLTSVINVRGSQQSRVSMMKRHRGRKVVEQSETIGVQKRNHENKDFYSEKMWGKKQTPGNSIGMEGMVEKEKGTCDDFTREDAETLDERRLCKC